MKKLLLLVLISFSTFPANAKPYLEDVRFNGAYRTICKAYDREYINREQSIQLLVEAYNYWNDNYVGSKATRIQETRRIFKNAGSDKDCLKYLENYVKRLVYPEL